jgi:deoxyadenosine/deoxycytidine kinase
MSLENRLKQLESILRSRETMLGRSVSTDDVIRHMGLDPVAVRESARNTGRSIVEIMCEMLGIEPREFVRLLKERTNLTR